MINFFFSLMSTQHSLQWLGSDKLYVPYIVMFYSVCNLFLSILRYKIDQLMINVW